MEKHSLASNLFSYPFYISGWMITGFCLLAGGLTVNTQLLKTPDIFYPVIKSGLLFGLFLTLSSRLKTEDELTNLIRLKSYEWAFKWGIINALLVSLHFPGFEEVGVFGLLLSMIIAFHVVFFVKNKQR
ncbi:MAG: hypothetical protein ACK5JC_09000 [Bacteroidota bacterium]|jgi:hypothetical protein